MNKSELIDAIASAANISKADAGRALNATTDAITGAMSSGEIVQHARVVIHKLVRRFKLKLLK